MPRCPKCVDSDPICLYCPTCQYVVSPDKAAQISNTCPRNCLKCPKCSANTIVRNDGETYTAACARCDYEYNGLLKRSFAGQIWDKDPERAEFLRLEAIYRGETPPAPTDSGADECLPKLVRLEARFSRQCKACRAVLVKPEPVPGIKFAQKSMALSMIPRFFVYDSKIRVLNPLPINVSVTIKSDDAVFGATSFKLGHLSNMLDEANLVKQVPESNLARESNFAKQIYMSGVRKDTEWGQQGPNWAETDYTVHNESKPVLVSCAIRYEAGERTHEMNLWIKWIL